MPKSRKIDAKREPKSNAFCSKNDPLTLQGRLILPFCLIFEGSKNRRFFDADLEGQQIDKNRALEPQGPKMVLRVFAKPGVSGLDGPRAAAKYQRIRGINGKNHEVHYLTRRWA